MFLIFLKKLVGALQAELQDEALELLAEANASSGTILNGDHTFQPNFVSHFNDNTTGHSG